MGGDRTTRPRVQVGGEEREAVRDAPGSDADAPEAASTARPTVDDLLERIRALEASAQPPPAPDRHSSRSRQVTNRSRVSDDDDESEDDSSDEDRVPRPAAHTSHRPASRLEDILRGPSRHLPCPHVPHNPFPRSPALREIAYDGLQNSATSLGTVHPGCFRVPSNRTASTILGPKARHERRGSRRTGTAVEWGNPLGPPTTASPSVSRTETGGHDGDSIRLCTTLESGNLVRHTARAGSGRSSLHARPLDTGSGRRTQQATVMGPHRFQDTPHRYEMRLRSPVGSAFQWLHGALSSWEGGNTALQLAASALEDGTNAAYNRHWQLFCDWCARNELEPLPASPTMVVAYIGWLAERGTISATSLQPYLSAINSMHADFGMERPALGHLVARARAGMRRGQALSQTRDTRTPLPADAALRVLEDTYLNLDKWTADHIGLRWLRARYAVILAYVFMARQDSCVSLHLGDHGVDESYLWLRITEKMKRGQAFRRILRIPLRVPPVRGHASAMPMVAKVGSVYQRARLALTGDTECFYFQLKGEPQPTSRDMSLWLAETLHQLNIVAPAGFAYLGHSLRSGASSAAEAIGVSRYKGNWLGGWSQSGRTRELHYIDPSFQPTPASYALLGWLLDGHYVAEHVVTTRAPRHAQERADPGEL